MHLGSPEEKPASGRRIELGWLIPHELDAQDMASVVAARDCVSAFLTRTFSQFEWILPILERSEPVHGRSIEPTSLLFEGVEERDIRHWDFAFVLTRADLQSYYKPFTLAVPSRAVSVAVLSLARLAQEYSGKGEREKGRQKEAMTRRLCSLCLHLLGDLNGLSHSLNAEDYMFAPEAADDLEKMARFSEYEQDQLVKELLDVADERLEENPAARKSGVWRFYLRAAWIGRDDILSSILQARPWEFPFRLSRLTTAGLSALLLLIMTAEVWDLGMNQTPLFVSALTVGSLLVTSLFVIKRQNLLLRRGRRRLTEQTVFTNVSTTLIVLLGMTTTYGMMFGLVAIIGLCVFPRRLVEEWAASLPIPPTWPDYFVLAGFVASLGILIGALGASFEGNPYFRHVTYVDEEI